MNIFLTCLFNGLYKEYIWLHNEYEKNWSKPKRYSELTPKEIKVIIDNYESGLNDGSTKKLIFKKVTRIENILNKRLKKYQFETYNELNRFGNLKEFRLYQFVIAYKKALENYYKKALVS
ncbi:hypothetical protein N9V49_02215 [Flavobacteriaceae bacterium]|nr:hypothetical protein [Flavobacteriaceae bacterium]MDC0560071.1 hypothetical protein [Flavobacteriaceae bacterium]